MNNSRSLFSITHPIFYSLLSGLLLFGAWPVSPFTILIFVGWVPLLILSETENRIRFFLFSILAMFIWNAGTTWWIWNSTAAGAIGAIIANSFLMTLPLWGFHVIRTRFGHRIGLLSFVCFWLGFEYIHLNWQLSWPWLTLGNVFATHTGWVQWYEYLGTSGGSLWVLLVNVGVYQFIRNWKTRTQQQSAKLNERLLLWPAVSVLALLIFPLLVSYLLSPTQKEFTPSPSAANVVIVQPNIDPYNEKFEAGSTDRIIQKMISLSESETDANTRLVVWPETALPVAVWQDQAMQNLYYRPVVDFVERHPELTLVTGIETFKNYGTEKATITARENETDGTYYDGFNAAVAIKAGQPPQFYNKSKLVPGVETLPDFLLWLGPIFEKFGGTTGGYGKDTESRIFRLPGNPYVSAPIICYESIYGEYIASYVKKGANLLTIITNDGWWANTSGHKQHLHYARLHAIETRRWIARSANTGISAVISPTGQLVETLPWDTAGTIKYSIPPLEGQTFFVRFGDIISPIALTIMILLVIWNVWQLLTNRRKQRIESLRN